MANYIVCKLYPNKNHWSHAEENICEMFHKTTSLGASEHQCGEKLKISGDKVGRRTGIKPYPHPVLSFLPPSTIKSPMEGSRFCHSCSSSWTMTSSQPTECSGNLLSISGNAFAFRYLLSFCLKRKRWSEKWGSHLATTGNKLQDTEKRRMGTQPQVPDGIFDLPHQPWTPDLQASCYMRFWTTTKKNTSSYC